MSAPEMAHSQEPYEDPEADPRFRALTDGPFSYDEALYRLGYTDVVPLGYGRQQPRQAEPAVEVPADARTSGRRGDRRPGGRTRVRDFDSDEPDFVPTYEQQSGDEVAARQGRTVTGAAVAWAALDAATAKREGISVEEARSRRLAKLERARKKTA